MELPMQSENSRHLLSVTLDQLHELKRVLETASATEADPDAPVFELLDMVRKVRTDAILLSQDRSGTQH